VQLGKILVLTLTASLLYEMGLWDIERVKNAVIKGKITAEQYEEITGEEYIE
jgi:hypothetical protein